MEKKGIATYFSLGNEAEKRNRAAVSGLWAENQYTSSNLSMYCLDLPRH